MANPNPNEITRFKPGNEWRGNPGGRPKGRSLTSILRDALDSETDFDGNPLADGKQVADFVVQALIKHAMAGDAAMMKQLWDRKDGTASVTADDVSLNVDVTDDMAEAMIQAGLKAKGVTGGPDS